MYVVKKLSCLFSIGMIIFCPENIERKHFEKSLGKYPEIFSSLSLRHSHMARLHATYTNIHTYIRITNKTLKLYWIHCKAVVRSLTAFLALQRKFKLFRFLEQ